MHETHLTTALLTVTKAQVFDEFINELQQFVQV